MNRERILIAAFLVLTAGLIVGQRFGFTWAGGARYEVPLYATVDDTRVARGETVHTIDQFTKVDLAGFGTVWMDKNTDMTLERLTKNQAVLRMDRGRIVLEAGSLPIEIRMDTVEAILADGRTSFVNVDFERRAHIIPQTGTVQAGRHGQTQTTVTTPTTLFYDKDERMPAAFNPLAASVRDFYAWAGWTH